MQITVYYDAVLVNVLSAEQGNEKLVIEYKGQEVLLATTSEHAAKLEHQVQSGQIKNAIGAAILFPRKATGETPAYYFTIYSDPTLRRAFELDTFEYHADDYNVNCLGWKNERNPFGFLAPKGLIPGKDGNFITDGTEAFDLDVPYQFTNLCTSMGSDTVSVLRDFIATACQLHDTPELPRADFFSSKGQKAEKLIAQYFDLAYRKKD